MIFVMLYSLLKHLALRDIKLVYMHKTEIHGSKQQININE